MAASVAVADGCYCERDSYWTACSLNISALDASSKCLAGNHTCDLATEHCIDELEGFTCICKLGFELDGPSCTGMCHSFFYNSVNYCALTT